MNAYREVEFSDMLPPAKNLKITSLAFQIILLLFFSGLWMPWTCARPSVLRAWTLYTLCDPHLDVLVSWSFLFWLLKNTLSYSYVGELGESKNARKKRKVVCPDTFPRPPPMRFGSLYPTRRVNILLRLRSCRPPLPISCSHSLAIKKLLFRRLYLWPFKLLHDRVWPGMSC